MRLARPDLDGRARSRIPTDPCSTIPHLEDAETGQADFVTLLQIAAVSVTKPQHGLSLLRRHGMPWQRAGKCLSIRQCSLLWLAPLPRYAAFLARPAFFFAGTVLLANPVFLTGPAFFAGPPFLATLAFLAGAAFLAGPAFFFAGPDLLTGLAFFLAGPAFFFARLGTLLALRIGFSSIGKICSLSRLLTIEPIRATEMLRF